MDKSIESEWNGYIVRYNKYDGYTAYDDEDIVFQIRPDGMTRIRTQCDGIEVYFENLTIDDIKDLYTREYNDISQIISGDL